MPRHNVGGLPIEYISITNKASLCAQQELNGRTSDTDGEVKNDDNQVNGKWISVMFYQHINYQIYIY